MAKLMRKPRGKYIVRRMTLVLLALFVVGFCGWYMVKKGMDIIGVNSEPLTSPTEPELSSGEADTAAAPVNQVQQGIAQASSSQAESQASSTPEGSQPASSSEMGSQPVSSAVADSSASVAPAASQPAKSDGVKLDSWEMILVNDQSRLPANYLPELEVVVDTYKVDKRIADVVRRMFAGAKEAGITLQICSAYRSPEYQETLFNDRKKAEMAAGKNEKEAEAATAVWIAVPYTSEHHTGLALDIVTPSYTDLNSGFDKTPAFKWLNENAYKYGFIMRFPKGKENITRINYEPWHYRYVGVEAARAIKESGLCLEEYIYLERQKLHIAANADIKEPEDESEAENSSKAQ